MTSRGANNSRQEPANSANYRQPNRRYDQHARNRRALSVEQHPINTGYYDQEQPYQNRNFGSQSNHSLSGQSSFHMVTQPSGTEATSSPNEAEPIPQESGGYGTYQSVFPDEHNAHPNYLQQQNNGGPIWNTMSFDSRYSRTADSQEVGHPDMLRTYWPYQMRQDHLTNLGDGAALSHRMHALQDDPSTSYMLAASHSNTSEGPDTSLRGDFDRTDVYHNGLPYHNYDDTVGEEPASLDDDAASPPDSLEARNGSDLYVFCRSWYILHC